MILLTSNLHNNDGHNISGETSQSESTGPGVQPDSEVTILNHSTSAAVNYVSNKHQTRHGHTLRIHSADIQNRITALQEEESHLGISGLGIRLSGGLTININGTRNDEVSSYRNETLATLEGSDNDHDDVPPPYELGPQPPSYQPTIPGEPAVSTRKLHDHPDRRGMVLPGAASSDQSYSTHRTIASPSTASMMSLTDPRMRKSLGHTDRNGIADFSQLRFSFDDIPGFE